MKYIAAVIVDYKSTLGEENFYNSRVIKFLDEFESIVKIN